MQARDEPEPRIIKVNMKTPIGDVRRIGSSRELFRLSVMCHQLTKLELILRLDANHFNQIVSRVQVNIINAHAKPFQCELRARVVGCEILFDCSVLGNGIGMQNVQRVRFGGDAWGDTLPAGRGARLSCQDALLWLWTVQ